MTRVDDERPASARDWGPGGQQRQQPGQQAIQHAASPSCHGRRTLAASLAATIVEQTRDLGDRRRLVTTTRHLAAEIEAHRLQRQAADHGERVVDQHDLAVRSQAAQALRVVHLHAQPGFAARRAAAPSAPGSETFRRSAGCSTCACSMSAVNCRRARSGPTISRGDSCSGIAVRVRDPRPSGLRSPLTTSGSWVTTIASLVLAKHLRVKFSDATSAGPSSATRYLAWYLTTGSV